MRVNVAAAAGAAIAALLAALGHAKHPAQVVVTIPASCAFLALLTRRRQVTRSDWFTVRLLLAGNLVVLGASDEHQLGVPLAATAILSGLALLLVAIRARIFQH
jgi:drug/metabolite transporter (DMT)-like permease